ncbi:unnamed protein product [Ectocarpus sp. 13 AM-2016]
MPSAKKQRSKKKKAAAPAAPKRSPAVAAAASRIEAANATLDLSAGLEAFLSIDLPAAAAVSGAAAPTPVPAEPVRLEIRSPKTLLDGDAQVMYDLLQSNMHDMYMAAGWGWNKAEKWREMEHRNSRFLIARCGAKDDGGSEAAAAGVAGLRVTEEGVSESSAVSGAGGAADSEEAARAPSRGGEERKPGGARERIAGYCDFRFAWDQDENEDGEGVGGMEDVLYVYELQVAPWATRRGLGRRMMQAIELLANRHGMTKVMLTVFKENRRAMSFYTKKMRYGVDKDSPSNWDQPDEVYEILSKPTRQGAARTKEAQRTATLLD